MSFLSTAVSTPPAPARSPAAATRITPQSRKSSRSLGQRAAATSDRVGLQPASPPPDPLPSDGAAEFARKLLQLFSAGHQILQIVHRDFGLGVGAERSAAIEHGESVPDGISVPHVVGDENDAKPLLADEVNIFEHHR